MPYDKDSWTDEVRKRVKKGVTYKMQGIGKVKVVGEMWQYGGEGSGGALFVEAEIIERERSVSTMYKNGTIHELSAEFMHPL